MFFKYIGLLCLISALTFMGCGGEQDRWDLEPNIGKAEINEIDLLEIDNISISGTNIESYIAWALHKRGLPGNCELVRLKAVKPVTANGGLVIKEMRISVKSFDLDDDQHDYRISPSYHFEEITQDRVGNVRHYQYYLHDIFGYKVKINVKVNVKEGRITEFHGMDKPVIGSEDNRSSCVEPPQEIAQETVDLSDGPADVE